MKKQVSNCRFKVYCLVLVSLLLLAGCGTSMTDVEHIQKAKEYQSKSDWSAAVIEFKNALRQNPGNTEARFLLGETYLFIRQGENAEKELRHALNGGFSNELLPVYLGRSLLYQSAFKRVLDEVNVSNDYSKEINAKLLAIRGEAFFGLNKLESARQAYQQALEQSADLSEALLGLAKLEIKGSNYAGAKKQIEHALEVDESNWEAWLIKGDLSFVTADYAMAEQTFRTVVDYGDGAFWKLQGRLGLVKTLLSQKQENRALSEVNALLKDFPNHPMPKFFRAQIAYNKGDFDIAKEKLLQVVKVLPDHKPSFLLLGAIDFSQGNLEQADEYLSRFVAARPDHVPARKLLAETRMKQDQPELAMEALSGALVQAPDDTQLLAMVGQVAMHGGDAVQGVAYFKKALAVEPDNSEVRIGLARAYLAEGQYNKGVKELTKVVESGEAQEKAGTLLVLAHLQHKKSQQALTAAKKLLKKSENSPIYLNLVGVVYLELGKKEDARHYFEKALKVKKEYLPAAINLARSDQNDGKLDAASRRYERILQWKPDHTGSMIALSRLAIQQGDEKGALEWLEKARKSDASAVQPRLLLANYYLYKGEPEKAVTLAAEAVSIGTKSADALLILGKAQFAAGNSQQAVSTYQALVNENPESALAWLSLGRLQLQQNSLSEARRSLKKALKVEPKFFPAASLLVRLELSDNRPEAASVVVKNLKKSAPDMNAAHILEGDLLMAQHKFAEASKVFQKAFKKEPNGLLASKTFIALNKANQQKSAIKLMTGWLKAQPGDVRGRLELASVYQQMEQYDLAQPHYEYILKRDENNAFALNNLALLLHKQGDSKALDYAEKASRLQPENGAILDTLGWILVQKGEIKRGEKILREALVLAPHIPDTRYHLAVALAKSGKTDEARETLLELINSSASKTFGEIDSAQSLFDQL